MKLVAEYTGDEDFIDEDLLGETIDIVFNKVFPSGECAMIARNHGWMKRNGYRDVETYKHGIDAFRKCLIGDARAKVYIDRNKEYGYHIAINTVHHDSPMWGFEWSYLVREKYLK